MAIRSKQDGALTLHAAQKGILENEKSGRGGKLVQFCRAGRLVIKGFAQKVGQATTNLMLFIERKTDIYAHPHDALPQKTSNRHVVHGMGTYNIYSECTSVTAEPLIGYTPSSGTVTPLYCDTAFGYSDSCCCLSLSLKANNNNNNESNIDQLSDESTVMPSGCNASLTAENNGDTRLHPSPLTSSAMEGVIPSDPDFTIEPVKITPNDYKCLSFFTVTASSSAGIIDCMSMAHIAGELNTSKAAVNRTMQRLKKLNLISWTSVQNRQGCRIIIHKTPYILKTGIIIETKIDNSKRKIQTDMAGLDISAWPGVMEVQMQIYITKHGSKRVQDIVDGVAYLRDRDAQRSIKERKIDDPTAVLFHFLKVESDPSKQHFCVPIGFRTRDDIAAEAKKTTEAKAAEDAEERSKLAPQLWFDRLPDDQKKPITQEAETITKILIGEIKLTDGEFTEWHELIRKNKGGKPSHKIALDYVVMPEVIKKHYNRCSRPE